MSNKKSFLKLNADFASNKRSPLKEILLLLSFELSKIEPESEK